MRIVERDQVKIHLQLSDKGAGLSTCYIAIDGVDSVLCRGPAGERAGNSGHEAAPSIYGMRDFNIADADGNTVGFGQP